MRAEDILKAFTIDHTVNGEHFISKAELSADPNDSVLIRGKFFKINGYSEDIGYFVRRLYRRGDHLRSYHMAIKIVPPHHRLKHIGTAHYRSALQFYVDAGIVNVHMEADEDGPSLWPGFGFDLVDDKQRDRLLELIDEELAQYEHDVSLEEVSQLRPLTPLLAALEVAIPDGNGGEETIAVGEEALRRLYRELGEPLRMTWWLDQPSARYYLEELGVKILAR